MRWRIFAGILACALIIIASFLHWAWYPDIDQYFTGWHSEQNYYGKPAKVMTFFAAAGIVFFAVNKMWSKRLNLFFAALNMGYAIKSYILFTSSYSGFVPKPQPGIFLMMAASIAFVVMAVMVFGSRMVGAKPVA